MAEGYSNRCSEETRDKSISFAELQIFREIKDAGYKKEFLPCNECLNESKGAPSKEVICLAGAQELEKLDRNIESSWSDFLEPGCPGQPTVNPEECADKIQRVAVRHGVLLWTVGFPDNGGIGVYGENAEAYKDAINHALKDMNLPKIDVSNMKISQNGAPYIPFSCCVTKRFLEASHGESDQSASCELIVCAKDFNSNDGSTLATYAVVPAHLIFSLRYNKGNFGNCDISQIRQHVEKQVMECQYEFKNENHEEPGILQQPPLLAYRHWTRSSYSESEQHVKSDEDEPSVFLNDIALLKFKKYTHDALSEKTEILQIPTKRHLDLLAKRKQRVFVGDLEGMLIYNPQVAGSPNGNYGQHLSFIITTKDPNGKISELPSGSSGLIIFFKGKQGQLIPVGMLVGKMSVDIEAHGSGIYQAIVLSQALKEIEQDYPRLIAGIQVLETCHRSNGANMVTNQLTLQSATYGSSDTQAIGATVASDMTTAQSEMKEDVSIIKSTAELTTSRAMAQAQPTIECGFCLRKNEELPSPKTLPCTHVHCLECLRGFFEEKSALVCPVENCGLSCDGSPDTLPSHDMGGDDKEWCDVCVHPKLNKEVASTYCTHCSKKFCEQHLELHDEVSYDHIKISMEEYKVKAVKKQTRNCTRHEDQPYAVGCKLCLMLACMKCLPELDKCSDGAAHTLMSLDDLVAALMKEGTSAKMVAKEDQYEKLFKEASKAKAEYDEQTAAMVHLIHTTRDEQINALNLQYKKLEDDVVERRQKSRVDMTEFMEDIVLKRWTQLRNRRQMVESRVKRSHQADVVKGFKELKEEIQKSVEEGLPKLHLRDEVQLKGLGESRVTELDIVSSNDIVIDSEQEVTTVPLLPQSVTLLKSVQPPDRPISVCQYKGSTYVGLDNKTVTRIDNNYKLYNSFISTSGKVQAIAVYNDRLYTLSNAEPFVVNVCDMSGGHITCWNHPYYRNVYSNMLTVVADQVVIADPRNKRITVYSLTGESLRHIPCPLLGNSQVNMRAVDNTSVVVSDFDTSKVFRVNMTTGQVMWTVSDVNKPQGLVRYGSYILLAAYNNNTIYILDTTTGDIVSKLADDDIAGDHVLRLEVSGTILVVPKLNARKLLYYQMNEDGKSG